MDDYGFDRQPLLTMERASSHLLDLPLLDHLVGVRVRGVLLHQLSVHEVRREEPLHDVEQPVPEAAPYLGAQAVVDSLKDWSLYPDPGMNNVARMSTLTTRPLRPSDASVSPCKWGWGIKAGLEARRREREREKEREQEGRRVTWGSQR